MTMLYLGLLTVAVWLVTAALVVAGTLAVLLGTLVGGRHLFRGIRRLVIWLDEEEHSRRAARLRRLLHSYNQARDEVKEIKDKIKEEQEVVVIKMHGKTLKQKTEILQRREYKLLAELPEKED